VSFRPAVPTRPRRLAYASGREGGLPPAHQSSRALSGLRHGRYRVSVSRFRVTALRDRY
jgi:hypothetical protein